LTRTDGSDAAALEAVQRTDALLARLPERDWTSLTDIDPRYGIDHVLVGRGGVFVLASRKPLGAGVRVRDGVLWLRHDADARADRPGVAINRQALDAARLLQREIRTRTGLGPPVTPVVVLWCEFPQRVSESTRIAFVHGRDLIGWLSEHPRRLDEGAHAEIVRALRASRSSGVGGRTRRLHVPHPHRGPGRRAA
jgi:Nuclease-related domain